LGQELLEGGEHRVARAAELGGQRARRGQPGARAEPRGQDGGADRVVELPVEWDGRGAVQPEPEHREAGCSRSQSGPIISGEMVLSSRPLWAIGWSRGGQAMAQIAPTARTRVQRLPKRGVYDRAAIDAILDEGLVCPVGFAVDGQPYVI